MLGLHPAPNLCLVVSPMDILLPQCSVGLFSWRWKGNGPNLCQMPPSLYLPTPVPISTSSKTSNHNDELDLK